MNERWEDNPALKPDGNALREEMFSALDAAIDVESRLRKVIEHEADGEILRCVSKIEDLLSAIAEILFAEVEGFRAAERKLREEILSRPQKEVDILSGLCSSLLSDCEKSRKPTIGCPALQPDNLPKTTSPVSGDSPVPVISKPQGEVGQKTGVPKTPALPSTEPYRLPDPPGGSSLQDFFLVGLGEGARFFLAGFPREFYDWRSGNPVWFSLVETPVSFAALTLLRDTESGEGETGVIFANYGGSVDPVQAEEFLRGLPIDLTAASILSPLEVYASASKRWGELAVRNLWNLLGVSVPVLVDSPDWRRDNLPNDSSPVFVNVNVPELRDAVPQGDGKPQVFVENRILLPEQSEVSLPSLPSLSDAVSAALDLLTGKITGATAAQLCNLTKPLGVLLGVDHRQFPPCVSLAEMIQRRG